MARAFSLSVILLAAVLLLAGLAATAAADPCPASKVVEVLSPASETNPEARIETACDLILPPGSVVTKRVTFLGEGASGASLQCNGASFEGGRGEVNFRQDMILVASRKVGSRSWQRPENIRIENCTVTGSVRVLGITSVADHRRLSRCEGNDEPGCAGFTRRAQDIAPRRIAFRRMTISGVGRNPFYLGIGVTESSLADSELKGDSDGIGIYLDAESAHNVIRNNSIHVRTGDSKGNPQIAIDGSAYNIIAGNRFSALNRGGIYLYRNCGERGAVRHQAPQYNRIINNVFFYDRFDGKAPGNPFKDVDNHHGIIPAVFLGSRQGRRPDCDADNDVPFGSGASGRDFAQHNIIADNRIVKLSATRMIAVNDEANELHNNVTVSAEQARQRRPSGCYEFDTLPHAYLRDGEATSVRDATPAPICGTRKICEDGLVRRLPGRCVLGTEYAKVDFECEVEGNNDGARCIASCPAGFRLFAAKAACSLETNRLSRRIVNRQGWGTLKVVRSADGVSSGLCALGQNELRQNAIRMPDPGPGPSLTARCDEHDSNGGDCRIAGTLACFRNRVVLDPIPLPPVQPLPRFDLHDERQQPDPIRP